MTPIAFDGCFGWLHPAAGGTGVVMCGSIGFEKQIFHRSWRFLAERLAAAGHPTLRFDYPGSGDSAGTDADPDALAAWLRSIEQATSWLRANTGVKRIVLCGIHLGGLLAAAAATSISGVERLVLLAPVLSGRTYSRTLALSAKIDGVAPGAGCVEAYGLRLHETTLRAMRPLDLGRLAVTPAPQILILSPTGAAGTEAAAAALSDAGAEVTLRDMPDYLELTRPAHESAVPVASFDTILGWLAGPVDQATPRPARAPSRPIPVAELRLPGAIERPLLLGRAGERVFGVFCEPTTPARNRTALLICNTGANPHYGYGRLAVTLARELARDGIASVRLDVSGLGDSDGASTVSLPALYSDRGADLRAATDLLHRHGYDRVVSFGICTGAYHSLRAAMADSRIAGVILVNQIVYRWNSNSLLFRAEVIARALRARLRGERGADAEQELLRLRIAPPNPTKNKIRRILLRAAALADNAVLRPLGLHTAATWPTRAFQRLASHGVKTLIVAGEHDYARSLLQAQFGPTFTGMRGMPQTEIAIESDFDHPVGQSPARTRLIGLIHEFMTDLASDSATPPADVASSRLSSRLSRLRVTRSRAPAG